MSRKKRPLEPARSNGDTRNDTQSDGVLLSNNNDTTDSLKNQGKERTRVFATIVYPDSAPTDWRDKLDNFHVEALISPLHDKDVNPDGTQKKPHYHVLIIFAGVKTKAQADVIRTAIGGVGWENVASVRGYARYLCHMDNPEKAQYDPENVVEVGGADYQDAIRRAADGVKLIREMTDFIRENDVRFYADFFEWCADNRPDWYESLVTRNTYPVYTYIKSRQKKADILAREAMYAHDAGMRKAMRADARTGGNHRYNYNETEVDDE